MRKPAASGIREQDQAVFLRQRFEQLLALFVAVNAKAIRQQDHGIGQMGKPGRIVLTLHNEHPACMDHFVFLHRPLPAICQPAQRCFQQDLVIGRLAFQALVQFQQHLHTVFDLAQRVMRGCFGRPLEPVITALIAKILEYRAVIFPFCCPQLDPVQIHIAADHGRCNGNGLLLQAQQSLQLLQAPVAFWP